MYIHMSMNVCLAMFVYMKKIQYAFELRIENSFYHKAVAHSCAHLSSEKKSKFAGVLPLDTDLC